MISFTFDNLGRLTTKDLPSGQADITYTYDNLGRLLTMADGSTTLTYGWNALGQNTSQASSVTGTMAFAYDAAGERTQITWPDSFYVNYDYDLIGGVTAIRENGATTGIGVLAAYTYDNYGRRTGVTYGNGASAAHTYDNAGRLSTQSIDLSGLTYDVTYGFSYNPNGQLAQRTVSNTNYVWIPSDLNTSYSSNGLN